MQFFEKTFQRADSSAGLSILISKIVGTCSRQRIVAQMAQICNKIFLTFI